MGCLSPPFLPFRPSPPSDEYHSSHHCRLLGHFVEMPAAKDSPQNKERVLAYVAEGFTVEEAADKIGTSDRSIYRWKAKDATFAAALDAHIHKPVREKPVLDPEREMPDKGPFVRWRMEYLGRPTPRHQLPIVRAYEDRTNRFVIVLGPPGSGKDTTAGELILHAKCDDTKQLRVAWLMRSEKFSQRRLTQRLEPYLVDPMTYERRPLDTPGGQKPAKNLITDFGPFRWSHDLTYPDGTKVPRAGWNNTEKYFVRFGPREADPDLWASGIQGNLYGSRIGLLVLSDPWTPEDRTTQPPTLQGQVEWVKGTVRSRLDGRGRLIVLGTKLFDGDPYDQLISYFVGQSQVVESDGYYTKYANGVATVIYPAIQHDADGNEVSYWPERFPLEPQWEIDGQWVPASELDAKQANAQGASRIEGLGELREADPKLFETLYQQNPPPRDLTGSFTRALLDHCDDASRTFGVYHPSETLVLGIDPALSGGAGWVLWGVNQTEGTATVVDFFFGEGLGSQGLRSKLIEEPLRTYRPRWTVYESNRDTMALDFPEIQQAIEESRTTVRKRYTGPGRAVGDDSVPRMAFDMSAGAIRIPAATPQDQRKAELFKQHFLNWDQKQQGRETNTKWRHIQDDLAMAAYVGWVSCVKPMLERLRKPGPIQRLVPSSVRERWTHHPKPKSKPKVQAGSLIDQFYEWEGSDAS